MRDKNLGFCLPPTATHWQCAFIQTDINNKRHRVLAIMLATLFLTFSGYIPENEDDCCSNFNNDYYNVHSVSNF